MSVPPKLIHRFNAVPTKIPTRFFFVYLDKIILKFKTKTTLEKNKVGEISLLDFRTY